MTKLKGYWIFFPIAVVGFIIANAYNPDLEKRCFKAIEKEKSSSLYGVVTKKYYVNGNMYPNIEVSSQDSKITKKSFHAEKSGLFDYIEVGDSISKSLNSLDYTIIRGDTVKTFRYTMFCNEDGKENE